MAQNQAVTLIGRLAIQLKLITMEQLREATREQASKGGDAKLGQVLVELGYINPAQLQKLHQVQRDVIAKHKAKQVVERGGAQAPETPQAQAKSAPQSKPAPMRAPQSQESTALAPGEPVEPEIAESAPEPIAAPVAEPVPEPVAAPPVAAPAAPAMNTGASEASTETDAKPGEPNLELPLCEPSEADIQRLHQLLGKAVEQGASDIHLHALAAPKIRVHGALRDLSPDKLSVEEAERMVAAALTAAERKELRQWGELDTSNSVDGVGRFRTNVYRQQRGFDVVMRSIPPQPPTLDELGLPSLLAKHTNYHQGMVLVTGPTGSGKSSTMAALVNLINEERDEHILTVEDPIEVVHPSKNCLVNQRHAGRHTKSFARALRGALREDPDVIVIGELRDLETISLAMTAAETGHFVLATLHTNNAVRTINRMIGAFPSNEQGQVRTMLSESLRAVISQRLVPTADGSGRVPALELLLINKAIGNLIRDEKTVQVRSAIQTGGAHGMFLLEQSLNNLLKEGTITRETALAYAEDPKLITG